MTIEDLSKRNKDRPTGQTVHPAFDTELGRRLIQAQETLLSAAVRRLHGESMLWSGIDPRALKLTDRCMVRHRFFLRCPQVPTPGPAGDACASEFRGCLEQIPMPSNQLDGVVLHHALDVSADPRAALRDVARVLAPGGSLLITGINPASLAGVHGAVGRLISNGYPGLHFVLPLRLLDWLSVLGFALDCPVSYTMFRPVWAARLFDGLAAARVRQWLHRTHLPLGGVYVVQARKQAVGMRVNWQRASLGAAKAGSFVVPTTLSRVD